MTFETIIAGGSVVDGTGTPPLRGDVGIADGRIAAIGDLAHAEAEEWIDATDACISPGFIDLHTHSDLAPFLDAEHDDVRLASLRQGVTTQICGNCGFSVFPAIGHGHDLAVYLQAVLGPRATSFDDLDAYARALDDAAPAGNLASLVGHGTVRAGAVGFDRRPVEREELRVMEDALELAFEQGAIGVSSGLIYAPGSYADTDELIALARVAARHNRPYVTHLRDEMDRVDEAIDEALRIGAESGAAVQISHHKTAGRANWGRTTETLERIERSGIDVAIDVYPYTAGSTNLSAVLPPWVGEGGIERLLERLRDPEVRKRIRGDLDTGLAGWQQLVTPATWSDVLVASAPRHPECEGRTIAELGDDPVDVVGDLLVGESAQVTVIIEMMAEDDVARVLASPLAMVGSDGIPIPGKPHPRWAGTFVRVLGKYVHDEGLLSVEEAVRKMTSAPAARFGLAGRGVLREGAVADIVVFDPGTTRDAATYEDPLAAPPGIREVFVEGTLAVRDGAPAARSCGRFITR